MEIAKVLAREESPGLKERLPVIIWHE